MSLAKSIMLPLGTLAPSFTLTDAISGQKKSLDELKSDRGTVVMFICNHCPFVKHIRTKLIETARTYQAKGIAFIAICPNDAENYLDDAPEKMKAVALQLNFTFPYLQDETQDVAKAYQATCTPDLYVFNKNLKLVYRGRFDGSSPGNNIPVTGNHLKNALDALLNGQPITTEQAPSMGCSIKWK